MMPEPIVICWSGGKDSALALYELGLQPKYDVVALLTTVTAGYDRVSMHGVRRRLLAQQAASLGIPLHEVAIPKQASNEVYEANMGRAFNRFRQQGIRTIAFGDIFLEDLREYRERQLSEHNLGCLFPIWKRDTRELVDTFLNLGFRAITVCVDRRVLAESFVGRKINRDFLAELPSGVDPCGENGEFHTFVYDGPNFTAEIRHTVGEVVLRDSFLFCDLVSEQQPEPASEQRSG